MRFSFSVGETRSKGGAAATKKNNICKRFDPRKCPMLVSSTGSSCLMRISLLRISLLRFFKTITKIWLMRFYGPFILLLRT